MNKNSATIFDKPARLEKSALEEFGITAAELDAVRKQIIRGLGNQRRTKADVAEELAMKPVGEFGSATNPVCRVSVQSCMSYLMQLRLNDGRTVQFVRKGCILDNSISPYPIDEYVLRIDNIVMKTIFMSGYANSDSKMAPKGLTLAG